MEGETPPGRAHRQAQYEADGGTEEDAHVTNARSISETAPDVEHIQHLTPNDPLQRKSKGTETKAEIDTKEDKPVG